MAIIVFSVTKVVQTVLRSVDKKCAIVLQEFAPTGVNSDSLTITVRRYVPLIANHLPVQVPRGTVLSDAYKGFLDQIVHQSATRIASTIFARGPPGNARLDVDQDSMEHCVIEAVQLLGVQAEAVIGRQGLVRQVVYQVTLDPTATQLVRDVITLVVTRQQVLALGTVRRVFTDQTVNYNVAKPATGQVATGLLADVLAVVQLDGTGSNVTSNVR